VKHLWLSIFLSLGIHAALFGLDISWLKSLSPVTPHPSRITITLAASQPSGEKKTSTLEKLSGIVEKTVSTLEEEALSNQAVKQMPKQPAKRKPAVKPTIPPVEEVSQGITMKKELMIKPEVKPIIPPLESYPQQTKITKETLIKKEVPEKKVKPKRSLKKLTKKKQKKEVTKDVAQIKSIQAFQPKLEPDYRNNKTVELEQLASKSTPSESSNNINQLNNSGTKSATESRPKSESTELATKGDTSAAAGLIMARPLYRKNPPPQYPKRARRKGYEGTVILEVLVDEKGTVKDLKVFESSGYKLLDKSAISSVQKWLFTPGTKDGDAAGMWVRIPVRFKLK
jgi:protein TonB